MRKTWVEMDNGKILERIPFVAFMGDAREGREVRHDFSVENHPIYHGNPDLFQRLSYETVCDLFTTWGLTLEISDDLSHAYERWIDPSDVYAAQALPRAFLTFLAGIEVNRGTVPSLLRDVEYGAINNAHIDSRPARNADGSRVK